LLEEAIESFLRQDYDGFAELLIVNDMADQELSLPNHQSYGRRVRILNLRERFMPNNLKFDFGVQEAAGEYCCFWDDDDLSFPWRLSLSVERMEGHNYYSMPWRIHYDIGLGARLIDRGLHGGDMFRRDAYLAVGGSAGDGHNDAVVVKRLKDFGGYHAEGMPEECFYVYRWGGITGHHSAYGASVAECMAKFDKTVRSDQRFRTGPIELQPRYHKNYEKLHGMALTKWRKEHA
jgi:glycosyltransferase involved in cell wall biosynthesis